MHSANSKKCKNKNNPYAIDIAIIDVTNTSMRPISSL